jgi:subtilisin-like proprotein convertase family protein
MRLRIPWLLLVAAGAAAVLAMAVFAATHPGGPITINDGGSATPYPATINVTGENPSVTGVEVTLTGLTHPFTDDIDMLLESPSGAKTILMSDAGNGGGVTGFTVTFNDGAASAIPDASPLTNGASYKPADYGQTPGLCSEPNPDVFPAPAPGGPYTASLATFNGTTANGTWNLYVLDDCAGDSGSISGWSLKINPPTAVGVRDFAGSALPGRIELRWRAPVHGLLGFHVYRSHRDGAARVNGKLIAAGKSSYRFIDRRVRAGTSYTYRLEFVRIDGSRSSAGIVALRAL